MWCVVGLRAAGFADLAVSLPCSELQPALNSALDAFEDLASGFGCTIVNSDVHRLFIVAGHDGADDHAGRALAMALEMLRVVREITFSNSKRHLQIRMGIDTGKVQAPPPSSRQRSAAQDKGTRGDGGCLF